MKVKFRTIFFRVRILFAIPRVDALFETCTLSNVACTLSNKALLVWLFGSRLLFLYGQAIVPSTLIGLNGHSFRIKQN